MLVHAWVGIEVFKGALYVHPSSGLALLSIDHGAQAEAPQTRLYLTCPNSHQSEPNTLEGP